jgi:signal transduction histidine kinase
LLQNKIAYFGMENSVKTLLENNLRNAYAHNDQNPEDFGFSVLIQFIKNYIYYQGVLPDFEYLIKNIQFIKNLKLFNLTNTNVFKGINFEIISLDDFYVSCDYLITYIISQPTYILNYTPEPLNDLIVSLLQPQPNQIIYDPVCGIGSTFVTLHKRFSNSNLIFAGQEVNPKIQFLCRLNLLLNAISDNDIFFGNSLVKPTLQYKGKIDIAMAVLPLGMKLNKESLSTHIFENPQDIPNTEYAFVELILTMLNDNGKAVIIVPDSFLSLKNGKEYRKKYIEQGIIEVIYSLPKEAFIHSSIKVSIIVFNKNKISYAKEIIVFAKLIEEGQTISKPLPISDITNFNLSANRYTHKNSDEFKKILENTPKNQIFTINQVAEIVRGKPYSKEKVHSQAIDALPYVGIKNLAANGILDIEKVTRKVMPDNHTKTINFSAILVSLLGTNLKLNYFEYQEQAIITSSDIVALRLKEGFDKDFILLQLQSRLVQIQAEMFVTGDIVERIAVEDFKNIQLIIPSPQEQQRQIIEMRGFLAEKNKARIEIAEAKEEIKITDYELIASVAHSFKNKLSPIVMDYAILFDLLREANEKQQPTNFNDFVRPILEGDTQDDIETIGELAARIDKSLKTLPKVFNDFRILQKEILKKEILNLNQYLEQATKGYISNSYKINIIPHKENLFVSIDKEAFQSVLENLIDNSVTHGFRDKNLNYTIYFDISTPIYTTPDGEKFARILYKDNGVGFIANYRLEDYKTFGNKSVYSKGSGIGGFIINKMVELHQGKVSFLATSEKDFFRTQIEILLPLED